MKLPTGGKIIVAEVGFDRALRLLDLIALQNRGELRRHAAARTPGEMRRQKHSRYLAAVRRRARWKARRLADWQP